MAQIPYELIRQVQIRTRTAAGLPDYDPSDPSLPALPPLSATIAASDPSSPNHRCRNCEALLLRGSDSFVCLYCGIGPHFNAVPDPISFTSTVGYQWLFHSLRLDGSEMVDTTSTSKPGKKQSSPQDLTPLSVFLDFKIQWPAETVNKEISFNQYLEDSKKSLILPGVAPDRFFLKSESKGCSYTVIEQPSDHKLAAASFTKDVAAIGDQDLFQNVQSSKPVSSSEHKTSEAPSGWAADFQFADTEDQLGSHTTSEHVTASSEGFDYTFRDPESFQSSSGLNVDLSAHLDSVFGGENLSDGKPKDSPSPLVAFGNWDSDDMWNNLTSSAPNLSDGFDANLNDQTLLGPSKDLSTSVDLFQDFQPQTNYADINKNKAMEKHTAMDEDIFDDSNDFASSTNLQAPSQNALAGNSDQVLTSEDKPSESDLFSFDDKLEGNNKASEITNKFEDDYKYSERDLYGFDNKFQDENKSSEIDLFSFESSLEGDVSGSPQKNLFSSSNNNAPADRNATTLADDSSNWFNNMSTPAVESVQTANNSDAFGQSTEDDVKTLISQMHDLSFMLETDLSIPSSSDEHKSVRND